MPSAFFETEFNASLWCCKRLKINNSAMVGVMVQKFSEDPDTASGVVLEEDEKVRRFF